MKNLLIQTLETKGVLGQIRSKLRSCIFKLVDEQDQKMTMGCGLKWENPHLYKITESKIGMFTAEIIREFMEQFRMDYSLSIFIPECSISPEKVVRDELFGKLGLKSNNSLDETPILYIIIYHFLYSIITDSNKVSEIIDTIKKEELESVSDKIINENLRNYYENNYGGVSYINYIYYILCMYREIK